MLMLEMSRHMLDSLRRLCLYEMRTTFTSLLSSVIDAIVNIKHNLSDISCIILMSNRLIFLLRHYGSSLRIGRRLWEPGG